MKPPHGLARNALPMQTGDTAWIATLPIACAIIERSDTHVGILATNRLFDLFDTDEVAALDPTEIAVQIAVMEAEDRPSSYICWQSPDPVYRRELEITVARFGEGSGRYILSVVDRTMEALGQVALRREMLGDALTGLPNRTGFDEEVEAAIARMEEAGQAARYGVLAIDLARFSRINECIGAVVGDEMIMTVARRMRGALGPDDIMGRIGGNEFAIFTADAQAPHALAMLAQTINGLFSEPCRLSMLEIQVECAMGGAYGTPGEDALDVIRHAQIALKRAKQSKAFELYSPGTMDRLRHRFSMETDLRRAIEREELHLHFQPLVDLESGTLSGFEALARWNHPQLGEVSPNDFIPVAEECGLIVPLGRWAIAAAADTLARWDAQAGRPLGVRIAVNLSAVQLARDDVPAVVSRALERSGIAADRLTLELTESAFINDPEGVRQIMEALKAIGTNLAMDDFGTGYSNLAWLQKLPLDVLKIDRSFVTDMLEDREKRAIVSTVLSLAGALGMQTTAEGVESEALSYVLAGLGCSFGQGYFWAQPLSADAAYDFIDAAT